MDVISFPAGKLQLLSSNQGPSNTFRFKFTDFRYPNTVTFFANSGVANASSSRPGNQQVLVSFDPTIKNSVFDKDPFLEWFVGGFRVSTRTI